MLVMTFTLQSPYLMSIPTVRIVVLGGHIDSIASGGATGRAPGADDDASGSSTVLEVFRSAMMVAWLDAWH
jgi:Zn-dependent M28 family amino/carboxypeptidase